MSKSKTNKVGSGIAFGLSILVLAFAAWLFLNRQFVLDQLTVWGYHPTAAVQTIDDSVQFTDKGTFTFYATKPAISDSDEFNGKCPRQETGSPILGCYTSDDRIYIFNISNQQLDGIKEVTAAHEMLHAVWHRMSPDEQKRISVLLTAAYEKSASPELKKRMEYYQRNEPDAINNELHSILGTEVSNLGSELETYYAQYFKNRQALLDLHAKYSAVYTSLNNQAETLYASMQTLSTSIEDRSKAYDSAVSQLTNDISSFNTRANNGSFSSISQFNSERAVLVNRSTSLENERTAINADISSYEAMYASYQKIASQIEVLNNSIDSFKALDETPRV